MLLNNIFNPSKLVGLFICYVLLVSMKACEYLKVMDKYLKMLSSHKIEFDPKSLSDDRLRYIHALDIFMQNRVKARMMSKHVIHALVDTYKVEIRLRRNRIYRHSCSCNDDICEHIIATLIAFEREPDSFRSDKDAILKKVMDIYKDIINSLANNGLEEDIELLNMLRSIIITSNDDRMTQHIIGLLSFSILSSIDNKYNTDVMKIINKSIAEDINTIIRMISNKPNDIGNRSWDGIITELINGTG